MTLLAPSDWKDYELIDCGDGAKLERFGSYVISRPDPRAVWLRLAPPDVWNHAHASFVRTAKDEGHWQVQTPPPADWSVHYEDLVFTLKPTSFKHVGVFPEQAVNWKWMRAAIAGTKSSVLNLFAYTGGASMAAALEGASVTHVDSSRGTVDWAKKNAAASGLSNKSIRWIIDDAYKFALRESRRGNTYDGIILDPPRFGRGTKGEVWKIEEDLPKLLAVIRTLLSPKPRFILINAYTADLSGLVIANLLGDLTHELGGRITSGELALQATAGERLLPNGIFARWSAS